MRKASESGRLPRVLSIVVLAFLLLLAGSAGYVVLAVATEPPIEELAHREAVWRARLIGDALAYGVTDGAAELGRTAARGGQVDVLTVDGVDRRTSPGVRLVFRVHVAMSRPRMAGRAEAEVDVCFRQVLDKQRDDYSRTEVPCPGAAPVIAPPPRSPTPGAPPPTVSPDPGVPSATPAR